MLELFRDFYYIMPVVRILLANEKKEKWSEEKFSDSFQLLRICLWKSPFDIKGGKDRD